MAKRTDEKQIKKNPAAVALSKLGASKGGAARAAKLSPERRSQIAKKPHLSAGLRLINAN